MTDKRKIYASAEESKAVMRSIQVTPAHLEALRLIDERGLNEQGVTNAKYVKGIIDICAQLLDQVRNLEAALERQASSGKDWAMRVDVLERTITTLRAQLAASSAQAGAAEKALRELESANSIALQLDARIKELEAQLEAVGAGGVEPLRRRDHFRDATEMVPLTESAIQAARTADYDVEDAPENWAFALGVRFAERAHGITQEQK